MEEEPGTPPALAEAADYGMADDGAQSPAELFAPRELSKPERGALLTALLFAGGEVVAAARLREYFNLTEETFTLLVAETAGALRALGLDILPLAGGLKLVTAAQWDGYLKHFHHEPRQARLSKSALEILAIVAYEQPVTRTRIDELRQVNSESTIRGLLDKRLLTVAGREASPGRPFLYRTTARFLEVFGLSSLTDLPPKPAALAQARGIALGTPADEEPAGLDELPGFDDEALAGDELED